MGRFERQKAEKAPYHQTPRLSLPVSSVPYALCLLTCLPLKALEQVEEVLRHTYLPGRREASPNTSLELNIWQWDPGMELPHQEKGRLFLLQNFADWWWWGGIHLACMAWCTCFAATHKHACLHTAGMHACTWHSLPLSASVICCLPRRQRALLHAPLKRTSFASACLCAWLS